MKSRTYRMPSPGILRILISAVLVATGSRAAAPLPWATPDASPAAVVAPSDKWSAPLTPEQLEKINTNILAHNKRQTINQGVSNLLGLTKNGAKLTLLCRIVKDDEGVYHGLYRLDGNTGYLVAQRRRKGVTVMEVDPKLKLVAAVYHPDNMSDPSLVPFPEAERILHDELLVWVDIVNTVIDPKPSPSPSPPP